MDYGADVVLGNDFGKTCSQSFFSFIEGKLIEQGYSVKHNDLFSGGHLTKYYGTQMTHCQSLQIELWYQTYIENRAFGNEAFQKTQDKMRELFFHLKEFLITLNDAEYK